MALRSRQSARDEPAETPVKRSHPLFWLLVLIALLAIGWSIYNRYASQAAPAMVSPDRTAPARRPASRVIDGQPLRPARTARPVQP